jgi:uncharacterized lipoprotein YmbA
VRHLAGLLVALGLVGCASAPQRMYALAAGVEAGGGDAERSVVVRAALPELVDRPQLVMRTGANQVTLLEQQRWAEPLRAGIPRVVAEDLGRLLGTRRVSNRADVIGDPDCRVLLDVRRFDSEPRAASVEALWTVTCGPVRRTGQTAAREPTAGGGVEALVAAHGRALDTISRAIAQALREVALLAAR